MGQKTQLYQKIQGHQLQLNHNVHTLSNKDRMFEAAQNIPEWQFLCGGMRKIVYHILVSLRVLLILPRIWQISYGLVNRIDHGEKLRRDNSKYCWPFWTKKPWKNTKIRSNVALFYAFSKCVGDSQKKKQIINCGNVYKLIYNVLFVDKKTKNFTKSTITIKSHSCHR